jgi:hypothetical protein
MLVSAQKEVGGLHVSVNQSARVAHVEAEQKICYPSNGPAPRHAVREHAILGRANPGYFGRHVRNVLIHVRV